MFHLVFLYQHLKRRGRVEERRRGGFDQTAKPRNRAETRRVQSRPQPTRQFFETLLIQAGRPQMRRHSVAAELSVKEKQKVHRRLGRGFVNLPQGLATHCLQQRSEPTGRRRRKRENKGGWKERRSLAAAVRLATPGRRAESSPFPTRRLLVRGEAFALFTSFKI